MQRHIRYTLSYWCLHTHQTWEMKMSVQVGTSAAPGSGRRSRPTALTLYSLALLMTPSFHGRNNKKWQIGWTPNCTNSLTVVTFRTQSSMNWLEWWSLCWLLLCNTPGWGRRVTAATLTQLRHGTSVQLDYRSVWATNPFEHSHWVTSTSSSHRA